MGIPRDKARNNSQVHNKPLAQKPDLAGRDGDVPGRQLSLHRPFIATLDKQRPTDPLNDIKPELTAVRGQRAQLIATIMRATTRTMT